MRIDLIKQFELGKSWVKLMLRVDPPGSYVGCLNVHAYDGLEPWLESRHRGFRSALRRIATVAGVPLCVSEHGNADSSGVTLAQAILEDFHYLQPASWCYWQPVEHHSSWGLVEADFWWCTFTGAQSCRLATSEVLHLCALHALHQTWDGHAALLRTVGCSLFCTRGEFLGCGDHQSNFGHQQAASSIVGFCSQGPRIRTTNPSCFDWAEPEAIVCALRSGGSRSRRLSRAHRRTSSTIYLLRSPSECVLEWNRK